MAMDFLLENVMRGSFIKDKFFSPGKARCIVVDSLMSKTLSGVNLLYVFHVGSKLYLWMRESD